MKRLEGKVSIVTGASRGIGRGIAVRLGQEGAKVVINHRGSAEGAEDTARLIRDAGQLGARLQSRPARFLRHPEHIGGQVFVLVLGVGALVLALAFDKPGVVFIEAVGDVLEEDQAEHDVLVFRRVHIVAQLVGGEPQLGLEAEGGADRGGGFGFSRFGHAFDSRMGVTYEPHSIQ